MKKILKLQLILTTVLVLVSCTSTHHSKLSAPLEGPSIENRLTTDIDVGQRVSGAASRSVLFGFIEWGDNEFADGVYETDGSLGSELLKAIPSEQNRIQKVRSAAAYDALRSPSADVILAPRYKVKTSDFIIFKRYTATVEGNEGKINNIRQVKRYNTDNTDTVPDSNLESLYEGRNFKTMSAKPLPVQESRQSVHNYSNSLVENYKNELKKRGVMTIKNDREITQLLGDRFIASDELQKMINTHQDFAEDWFQLSGDGVNM